MVESVQLMPTKHASCRACNVIQKLSSRMENCAKNSLPQRQIRGLYSACMLVGFAALERLQAWGGW